MKKTSLISTIFIIVSVGAAKERLYNEKEIINSTPIFAIVHTLNIVDSTVIRAKNGEIIDCKLKVKIVKKIFGKIDSIILLESGREEASWFNEDKDYLVYLYPKEYYYQCPGENNHCGNEILNSKVFWFKSLNSDILHQDTLELDTIIKRTLNYLKIKNINKF